MRVFDVEELPTHGGSLRVFACHAEDTTHQLRPNVARVIEAETAAGLASPEGYARFAQQVKETKFALVEFLLVCRRDKARKLPATVHPARALHCSTTAGSAKT